MCLNDSLESIVKLNDICNRAGLDTISTGATVAFAIECFENGLLTSFDTGGLDLTWGNDKAIVALTEQIAQGEGVGKIFENGIAAAAAKLGKESTPFAMHIGGAELPMHDPRLNPGLATSYHVDATPGRHTQGGSWLAEAGFAQPGPGEYFTPIEDKYKYSGKGETAKNLSCFMHAVNAAGVCMFGALISDPDTLPQFLSAVMGTEFSMDRVIETGWRIGTMRMAFTVREGIVPPKLLVPSRVIGKPPLQAGPLKGITLDNQTQTRDYLDAMGWDPENGSPMPDTVQKLGLDSVVK
jgi:aldehyde:ferredoxin oxidoreductase